MPIAGHRTLLKVTGDTVAMTTEACTLVSAAVAQVTNTARQILDPTVAISLYDNGVLQTGTTYVIDYLLGKATKNAGSWTGPVTITASYLPVLEYAEAQSCSIAMQRAELEKTKMGDADRSFLLGLKEATGSVENLALLTDDFDPGAGTTKVDTLFGAATQKVLEVTLNPDTPVRWRGLIYWVGVDQSAPLAELLKGSHKWRVSALKGNGRSDFAAWSLG